MVAAAADGPAGTPVAVSDTRVNTAAAPAARPMAVTAVSAATIGTRAMWCTRHSRCASGLRKERRRVPGPSLSGALPLRTGKGV